MKFSNTLEFNAVREWSTHYVHYARLKHLVREIGLDYAKAWQQERAAETTGVSTSDEESRLVEAAAPLLEQRTRDFLAELDRELAAVNEFYRGKETEFADEVRALQEMAGELVIVPLVSVHGGAAASSTTAGNASGTRPAPTVADSSSATASVVEMSDREPLIDHRQDSTAFEDQDHFAHRRNTASATLSAVHTSPSPPPVTNSRLAATSFDAGTLSPMSPPLLARVGSNDYARRLAFHAKAKDVYVNLCSLKEYVVLNYTAFAKILKKFDKMLGTNVRESYLPIVESSYFWSQNVDSARQAVLNDLIDRVVGLYANVICDGSMQRALSELGHFLREYVVWERNTVWRDMIGKERRTAAVVVKGHEPTALRLRVRMPFGAYLVIDKKALFGLVALLLFLAVLSTDAFDTPRQTRCLAVLLFASMLWASEAIPLFVTSMIIPFLVIALDLWDNPADQRTATKAKLVFGKMFAPVIMLLLGGFSIAAALSKFHIAKSMATFILSRAGTQSKYILLTVIFVATFSSMWISNVAAPVLCYSVIQPILRTLEPGNAFAKSLVMGIALASNVGGMVTPISSPQNAVGLNEMQPPVGWLPWLGVTVPISILSDFLCWLGLLIVYRPSHATPRVQPIRASSEPFNATQYFIILVTVLSIALWCLDSTLRPVFGNSGTIAIIPMVIFFSTGILSKDDWNAFPWTVIMLAMGGTVLGATVENTGLLHIISKGIQNVLGGAGVWVTMLTFCALALVAATFVSHTVSALIILPIVREVGEGMGASNTLVMAVMLMCSGAMGLPISGFPNINAVSLEDATGRPYVGTVDFLRLGVPLSVAVYVLTVTVGYGTMLLVGI